LSLEPKWLEPKTQLTDTTNTSWPLARCGPWPVKLQKHHVRWMTGSPTDTPLRPALCKCSAALCKSPTHTKCATSYKAKSAFTCTTHSSAARSPHSWWRARALSARRAWHVAWRRRRPRAESPPQCSGWRPGASELQRSAPPRRQPLLISAVAVLSMHRAKCARIPHLVSRLTLDLHQLDLKVTPRPTASSNVLGHLLSVVLLAVDVLLLELVSAMSSLGSPLPSCAG